MKFLRAAICALVVFGVAAHGGVEDWARAVFETGAGLLFVAWALWKYFTKEEQVVLSPLLPPMAAFSLVVCGQWFFHGTASSYSTRMELLLLVSGLIVLFVAVQAFRTLEDWRGFVWFGMFFGFLVSLFAILQHLTSNGKLYWFREISSGSLPFGPYVNRNHFAGFAELILTLALVPLVLGRVRRERRPVVGLLAVLPIAGRHRELRCRAGGISASDDSPAHDGEAMARWRKRLTGCIAAGLLARRWTDPQTAILRAITRSDGGKARLDAERHLADLSGSP